MWRSIKQKKVGMDELDQFNHKRAYLAEADVQVEVNRSWQIRKRMEVYDVTLRVAHHRALI